MRIEAVDRRGHRAGRCGGERRQRQAFGVARAAPHAQKAARSGEGAPTMTDETLAQFRQSNDNIDAALVFLLAERFRITKAVGRYKVIAALPPAATEREERKNALLSWPAHVAALHPELSEKFLRFIIDAVNTDKLPTRIT